MTTDDLKAISADVRTLDVATSALKDANDRIAELEKQVTSIRTEVWGEAVKLATEESASLEDFAMAAWKRAWYCDSQVAEGLPQPASQEVGMD